MTAKQHHELMQVIPCDREFGFNSFARKHGMTSSKVYRFRRKLSMPIYQANRHPPKQLKLF